MLAGEFSVLYVKTAIKGRESAIRKGKDLNGKPVTPGPVALFGSGETTPSGRRIFEQLFRSLPQAPEVAILETPAGFELNSPEVAGRIGEFLQARLQNYRPQIVIVPARKRGTRFSPDDPEIAAPLLSADLIFMGPGSPTYAARQLRDSLAWGYLQARHRLGAGLALASAAAVAIGAQALPVYEIYKVGEEVHWKEGLDFFRPYGLQLVFVPHWNNNDGGEELDTSRCFMGLARFEPLMEMLPSGMTVVGIDEQTGLLVDLAAGECRVVGIGGVTVLRDREAQEFSDGETFPASILGDYHLPDGETGLPTSAWRRAVQTAGDQREPADPPDRVQALVNARESAREKKDWETADALRDRIEGLGWMIKDTEEGPVLEKTWRTGERGEGK